MTQERGVRLESPLAEAVVTTVHPSSILRAPNDEARRAAREEFVKDLAVVRKVAREIQGR